MEGVLPMALLMEPRPSISRTSTGSEGGKQTRAMDNKGKPATTF